MRGYVPAVAYWGLRDYGTAQWEGGNDECNHQKITAEDRKEDFRKRGEERGYKPGSNFANYGERNATTSDFWLDKTCGKCGAKRIDSQLGLEKTPEEYVAKMVEVFREVRRVLRKDGTLWLNLGDSYAGSGKGGNPDGSEWAGFMGNKDRERSAQASEPIIPNGLKPKDLCGIPWRVAFALQADGWVLRSDVIWNKPNPMPESVTDRPTKSHEYLFLFSKAKWTGNGEPPVWISDRDKAWLAALVDAEGTICFQEAHEDNDAPTFSVRLSIVNCHKGLLERVASICNVGGGPGAPSPRHRSDGTNGRPVYSWQVTNSKAAQVIAAIRPYLIVKATQADLGLTVHVLNQKHKGRGGYKTTDQDSILKAKCAKACSELNHGETPDLSWFTPVEWGRWDSQPYMYDAEAIKEQQSTTYRSSDFLPNSAKDSNGDRCAATMASRSNRTDEIISGNRNKRSVWTVATAPYPEAHFATYPPDLIKPCIMAGTSAKGCCAKCGSPWERVVERGLTAHDGETDCAYDKGTTANRLALLRQAARERGEEYRNESKTIGWQPTCKCDALTQSCAVLDPFAGSGTTGMVALELGRKAILIELNPEYVELIRQRCNVTPGLALA